ncbi:hypothetical protein EUTSA_v10019381mg [Eutrema salsugineum]|uniref:Uncharacterized protein n=1 Tax=Eutrema salsugineum TaxID=72664 RepID=V4JSE6_EUTSA|nr:hypothetical protein EUTSA_v10019381mg [Eutrema salsugineum]
MKKSQFSMLGNNPILEHRYVSEPPCNLRGHHCAFASQVPNRRSHNPEKEEGVESIVAALDSQCSYVSSSSCPPPLEDAAKPIHQCKPQH